MKRINLSIGTLFVCLAILISFANGKLQETLTKTLQASTSRPSSKPAPTLPQKTTTTQQPATTKMDQPTGSGGGGEPNKLKCEGFAKSGNNKGFDVFGCCLLFQMDNKLQANDSKLRNKWLSQCIQKLQLLLQPQAS